MATKESGFDDTRGMGRWISALVSAWRVRQGRATRQGPSYVLSAEELSALKETLRTLTRGLGARRVFAGSRYMDRPDLLGAYLLYFWPVSYAQVRYCLAEAGIGPGRKGLRGLDLGAGPGPASCALYDCGASTVVAADRSRSALTLASEIARSQGHTLRTVVWDGEREERIPDEGAPYDVIVCSHLLNELWAGRPDSVSRRLRLLRSAVAHLSPAGVLIVVEPALHQISRELLAIRNGLVEAGLWITAPCITQGPCPALADENTTCHATVPWTPPRLLEEIAYSVGPHREALKMAYVVARCEPDVPTVEHGERWRVVSDRLLNKAGRYRVLLCGHEGRRCLSAGRDDTWPAMKDFLALRRGDLIYVANPVARRTGWALGSATTVTILRTASL